MKFLRYCHEIDLDLSDKNTQSFGNRSVCGYILNGRVIAIRLNDYPDLVCLFGKADEEGKITVDYALTFAQDFSHFFKETISMLKFQQVNCYGTKY